MKVYSVKDGSAVECDLVDAREMVASGSYTYDAPKPVEKQEVKKAVEPKK